MTAAPEQIENATTAQRPVGTTSVANMANVSSIRWALEELSHWTHDERLAYVVRLVRELDRRWGWAGEEELHRLTYLLQHLMGTPSEYAFALGCGGAYAVGLDEDLSELEAVGWLEALLDQPGRGLRYRATPVAERLLKACGAASAAYEGQLKTITTFLRAASRRRLELLTTAHFLGAASGRNLDEVLVQLRLLKPHYGDEALAAGLADLEAVERQLSALAGR
jgi:hypothetical protein